MATLAAYNDPTSPKGSQMHKRFERDAERIKKKFLMYSKRSLANTEETS